MLKRKNRKGQVVLFETILVLCIYLFLIGFLIDGMQMFYSKITLSATAYIGARTAIAYETDKDKQGSYIPGNYAVSNLGGPYQVDKAIEKATSFYNNVKLTQNEVVSITIDRPDNNAMADNEVFFHCEAKTTVKYLFPMISPTFVYDGELMKQEQTISQTIFMTRERVYD